MRSSVWGGRDRGGVRKSFRHESRLCILSDWLISSKNEGLCIGTCSTARWNAESCSTNLRWNFNDPSGGHLHVTAIDQDKKCSNVKILRGNEIRHFAIWNEAEGVQWGDQNIQTMEIKEMYSNCRCKRKWQISICPALIHIILRKHWRMEWHVQENCPA